MIKKKWLPRPMRLESNPTPEEITNMFLEFEKCKIDRDTIDFFKSRADLDIKIRLGIAIKITTNKILSRPMFKRAMDVLFTRQELSAMYDVNKTPSNEAFETAKKILCLRERQMVAKFFSKVFKDTETPRMLGVLDEENETDNEEEFLDGQTTKEG